MEKSIKRNAISFALIITLVTGIFAMPIMTGDSSVLPGSSDVYADEVTADWVKNYGGTNGEAFKSVTKTFDGGYVAVGYTDSNNGDLSGLNIQGGSDFLIAKFNSEGTREWIKTYGGNSIDEFYSVIQTSDGKYLAVGYSGSVNGDLSAAGNKGGYDFVIAKFNENGTKAWIKTYGGVGNDIFHSVVEYSGYYYAAGRSASQTSSDFQTDAVNNGSNDFVIAKFNSDGSLANSRIVLAGGSTDDYFRSIAVTSDNQLICAGYSASNDKVLAEAGNKGNNDFVIAKFDLSLANIWIKTYGGKGSDTLESVVVTSNGSIIAAGSSESSDGDLASPENTYQGGNDFAIAKFKSDGTKEWIRTFGGSLADYLYSVTNASDGGYVAVGQTKSSNGDLAETGNKGDYDFVITKFKSDGTKDWIRTNGGNKIDSFRSVEEVSPGKYIATGYFESTDGDVVTFGGNDIVLAKFSTNYSTQDSAQYKLIYYVNGGNQLTSGSVKMVAEGDGIGSFPEVTRNGYSLNGWFTESAGGTELTEEWEMPAADTAIYAQWLPNKYSLTYDTNGGSELSSEFQIKVITFDTTIGTLPTTTKAGYEFTGWFTATKGGIKVEETTKMFDKDTVLYARWSQLPDSSKDVITEEWIKNYGGTGSDTFYSVKKTSDGGFVAVGQSSSRDIDENTVFKGSTDFIIAKFTSDGTKEWIRNYGGSHTDTFYSVIQTSDDKYLAVGLSASIDGHLSGTGSRGSSGNNDFVIAKFNKEGTIHWIKKYGGASGDEVFRSVVEHNGNYYAAGYSTSTTSPDFQSGASNKGVSDFVIAKFNSDGSLTNSRIVLTGGNTYDYFQSIAVTPDNQLICAGYSESNDGILAEAGNKGNNDFVLAKFDLSLTNTWTKTYGGRGNDIFESVIVTSDGSIIAAGSSKSSNGDLLAPENAYQGDFDFVIAKFKSDGTKEWIRTYGGSLTDELYSVTEASDGGYVAAGRTMSVNGDLAESGNKGNYDYVIVKFKADGTKDLIKANGGNKIDLFRSVVEISPGNYLAAGFFQSTDGDVVTIGSNDFVLAKYSTNYSMQNPAQNRLTYYVNGGTPLTSDNIKMVTVGDGIGDFPEVTRKGYTPDGWFTESTGGTKLTQDWKMPSADTAIYAQWSPNKYTLTYDTNGGSELSPESRTKLITFDTTVGALPTTAKAGYKLAGWFTAAKGGTKVEETTKMFAEDTTIYARWSKLPDSSDDVITEDWIKNYGGTGTDYFVSVTKTSDGGFVAVGYTSSSDIDEDADFKGSTDFVIAKFTSDGTKEWIRNYGGSHGDSFYSVIQTSDGKYVAVGSSSSIDGHLVGTGSRGSSGNSDFVIAKFNEKGTVHWIKKYGGASDTDAFLSVVENGGNYYAAGYSNSSTSPDFQTGASNKGASDFVIAKFNSDGSLTNSKIALLGGTKADQFRSIAVTSDNQLICTGYSESNNGVLAEAGNKGNNDFVIAKFDLSLANIWIKTYGGKGSDTLESVVVTSNGSIIAAGSSTSSDEDLASPENTYQGGNDFAIAKFKSDGTKEWIRTFGGSLADNLFSVTNTSDGGCVAVGQTKSSNGDLAASGNKGDYDFVIAKFKSDGTKDWIRTNGGNQLDFFRSVVEVSPGKYLAAGYSLSTDGDVVTIGLYDFVLAKYSTNYSTSDPTEYTLTYDVNGGNPLASGSAKMVLESESIGDFPVVTRNGYTLNGWFTSSIGGIKLTKDWAMPATDTAIYAQWSPSDYALSFDSNGGSEASPTSRAITVDTPIGELPVVTKAGCRFDGWSNAQSGGVSVTSETNMFPENTTLYAKWIPNDYSLTLSANGGTELSVGLKTRSITFGALIGILPTTVRAGYEFAGWFTATAGGIEVDETTKMFTEDTIIYAQWSAKTFMLTYNPNGGTISSQSSRSIEVDNYIGSFPGVSRNGYSFTGWYTAPTGGTPVTSATQMFAEDTTVYARWIPNKYYLTLSANGGKELSTRRFYKTFNTAIGTLPTATRRGHSFKGWFTSRSGGIKITSYTRMFPQHTTVYAQWKAKRYKVIFKTGKKKMSKYVTYGKRYGKLPKGKRSGYRFIGWYTKSKGGKKITSRSIVKITSKITLYPRWKKR